MIYKYKNIDITLESEEIYWLWDIIGFALDYDAKNNCLNDEKRAFAKRLIDILDEMK